MIVFQPQVWPCWKERYPVVGDFTQLPNVKLIVPARRTPPTPAPAIAPPQPLPEPPAPPKPQPEPLRPAPAPAPALLPPKPSAPLYVPKPQSKPVPVYATIAEDEEDELGD